MRVCGPRRADRTITQIYECILAPSGLISRSLRCWRLLPSLSHLDQPPGESDGDGSNDLTRDLGC